LHDDLAPVVLEIDVDIRGSRRTSKLDLRVNPFSVINLPQK
jgi:hypothetical protein